MKKAMCKICTLLVQTRRLSFISVGYRVKSQRGGSTVPLQASLADYKAIR